jgi:hypothetical protein
VRLREDVQAGASDWVAFSLGNRPTAVGVYQIQFQTYPLEVVYLAYWDGKNWLRAHVTQNAYAEADKAISPHARADAITGKVYPFPYSRRTEFLSSFPPMDENFTKLIWFRGFKFDPDPL